MWGDIAISFLLAFITAFVLTPYTMRLAKKVGAIDVPNDRRVNKKPMPRLRWHCCYLWLFSFYYVFNNCNELRKNNKSFRRRTIWLKINRPFYRNISFRNYLLY